MDGLKTVIEIQKERAPIIMLASPVAYDKSRVQRMSALSASLRHLNTHTLALALFVACALLGTTRDKEPETRASAYARDTELRLAIKPCDTSLAVMKQIQGHKFTAKNFGNKIEADR
jgi:hypothetical protein